MDAALATGRHVVALLGSETEADLFGGLALCQALTTMAAPLAERIGALVSTGGELGPGVPLSVTADRRALPVITKAGAFGQPDALLRCRATLRSGSGTNEAETP